MLSAIVRAVAPALARCELTYLPRTPIDLPRAEAQHRAYVQALERAGASVEVLAPEPELPDAVFVEDTAVILDEVAVLARPGAETRRPEVACIADAVARRRPLARILEPGTLDGGDVLRVGSRIFVGLSRRTNAEGARQLDSIATGLGYEVTTVPVRGCLHFKSAVSCAGRNTLLLNDSWVDRSVFPGFDLIGVHPDEPLASNCLLVRDRVLVSSHWPKTRRILEDHGIQTEILDLSEFEKAEAALTCLSLLFDA
jgi:dimethylargininase